jgi:biopolymer transport protein ExbD
MAGKLAAPGHGKKRGRLEVTADPNVIPFIDIMLVLVIIFMIAAPISTVDIVVDMPDSQLNPQRRAPRPVWVTVQEERKDKPCYKNEGNDPCYFVGNVEVSIRELGERTKEEWEKNSPGQDLFDTCLIAETTTNEACRIYVRADGRTRYRNVVRAMNQLQGQGFMFIALVAEDRR